MLLYYALILLMLNNNIQYKYNTESNKLINNNNFVRVLYRNRTIRYIDHDFTVPNKRKEGFVDVN
jgi:hypothetical protein